MPAPRSSTPASAGTRRACRRSRPRVPRAAFAWVTKKLKGEVAIPLCTTNRINTPEVAEQVLADGCADMVSMARPLLADAEFVNKAAAGRGDEINTCIACNQACLDHVFQRRIASCLVNPRAGHETELVYAPTRQPKRIAVVGAGPAGLACATVLAERGHRVELFEAAARDRRPVQPGEADSRQGRVPGDAALLRAAHRASPASQLRLGTRVTADELIAGGYDEIVLATGVTPRDPRIEGDDEQRREGRLLSYVDVLLRGARSGSASRSWARAASASTSRSSWWPGTTRRPRTCRPGWRNGAWATRPPHAADCDRSRSLRRHARCTCCSARPRRSARGSARPRAGSTAPRSR